MNGVAGSYAKERTSDDADDAGPAAEDGVCAAPRVTRAATLLAFDYGEKRIGVALGNTLTGRARPLTVLANRSRDERFAAIGRLIGEWQPTLLVVGLPMHPDGAPHTMTRLATRFGNQLNGRFSLPVRWVDERYSSVEAEAHIRECGGAGQIDAEAARVILQQYLDGLDEHVSGV